MKRVAILSTGDELIQGDILNTNVQHISQALFNEAISLGQQATASDDQSDLVLAMRYLLEHHDALITIGGLGPTSDDRTRFALAEALNVPLIFDEASWQRILARFQQVQLKNQPDSNRVQALYPEGAQVLENAHGTASGCALTIAGKTVCMLPGPPGECLPMFETQVLPLLKQQGYSTEHYQHRWLLFGVSEGAIAESMDQVARAFPVRTGYRLRYPYVECKASATDQRELASFVAAVQSLMTPHELGFGLLTAWEQLELTLAERKTPLVIWDEATHGHLQARLSRPQQLHVVKFSEKSADIHLQGLAEFWQGAATAFTELRFNEEVMQVPHRGLRTLAYVCEWIAWKILRHGL